MALIRPRLTDFHGISVAQADLDFAIPFLDEDIPLYVDPFLLWKSPSQQDQALHTSVINSFNHLNYLLRKDRMSDALQTLIVASECAEVGLGHSKTRKGVRLGQKKAAEILSLFSLIDAYRNHGFVHFEEIQLYVEGVSADRVSDMCCSFLKSFLVDFTTQASEELGIPLERTQLEDVYDYRVNRFVDQQTVHLPVNPEDNRPILFVPKRWLRFGTWIGFDDYFRDYCPRDEIFGPDEEPDRVRVLRFNRDHYGHVREYVAAKERAQEDCRSDPLFKQIPVMSARRKLSTISGLKTGVEGNAHRKYEDAVSQLLASLLYPQLDFADEQSRTVDGVLIRDLIFYNNRGVDFLEEIYQDFGSRQLVFELKNVAEIKREHLNQLNRYLDEGLGKFGVLVTRSRLKRAMRRNTINLWSGQRRCILPLTDEELELMVELFESRQRPPIDVLKRAYIQFRRECPS